MKNMKDGFICPHCGKQSYGVVIDSRQNVYGRRRRRECEICGARYTTIEIYVKSSKKYFKLFMEGKTDANKQIR